MSSPSFHTETIYRIGGELYQHLSTAKGMRTKWMRDHEKYHNNFDPDATMYKIYKSVPEWEEVEL